MGYRFRFRMTGSTDFIIKAVVGYFDHPNSQQIIETDLNNVNPDFTFTARADKESYDENGDLIVYRDKLKFTIEPSEGFKLISVTGSGEVMNWDDYSSLQLAFTGSEILQETQVLTSDDEQQDTYIDYVVSTESAGGGENLNNPFTESYIVTSDILEAISNAPVYVDSDGNTLQRSEYVHNLLELPFNIEDFNPSTTDSNVVFGLNDTEVVAPKLNYSNLELNLGDIVIDSQFNNSIDFDCDYELIVPFISKRFDLPKGEISGKTINVSMVLDVYSNEATLNVKESERLIISEKVTLGREIPFQQFKYNIESGLSGFDGVVNDLKTCYVEIKKPVIEAQYNSNLVNKTGTVQDVNGYVISDNFKIGGLSLKDSTELMSIFSSGVYYD
ncbi:hypothetical protein VPHK58G2_0007 [Vibrio phage K58 g2]